MTGERIMHTHAPAITVRHVEAQPASGPHRPAMPEHYVTELDGQPLCWIPASALAPLLAEAEARGARTALLSAADTIDGADAYDELGRPDARGGRWTTASVDAAVEHSGPITDWLRARAEQAGGDRG